jgi:hypothetical protein
VCISVAEQQYRRNCSTLRPQVGSKRILDRSGITTAGNFSVVKTIEIMANALMQWKSVAKNNWFSFLRKTLSIDGKGQ